MMILNDKKFGFNIINNNGDIITIGDIIKVYLYEDDKFEKTRLDDKLFVIGATERYNSYINKECIFDLIVFNLNTKQRTFFYDIKKYIFDVSHTRALLIEKINQQQSNYLIW